MTKNVNAINYTDMVQLSIEELEMVTGGLARVGRRPPLAADGPIRLSSDETNTGNQKYFKK